MKVDDLTVFFRLIDRSKGTFGKIEKRFNKLGKVAKIAFKGAGAVATTLTGALVAAAAHGSTLTSELEHMRLTIGSTFQESQALFNSIRKVSGVANIDNINEAILTMKERFADARIAGAGPLVGLIEDFGLNIDLQLDKPRAQLANFLSEVSKLETANEQIFALKDVLGDDDARAFLRIIQDTEKLSSLLTDLRTDIDDLPNILRDSDVTRIREAKAATNGLAAAWDNFAIKTYALVAPAIEGINNGLAWLLDKVLTPVITKLQDFFTMAARIATGNYFKPIEDAAADSAAVADNLVKIDKVLKKGPGKTPGGNTLDTSKTKFGPEVEILPPQVKAIDLIRESLQDQMTIYQAQMDRNPLEVPLALKKLDEMAPTFTEKLDEIMGLVGQTGGFFDTLDSASADAFSNELSRIDAQKDILQTKAHELNQARVNNQLMMQQLGVANLKQNPFDGELEKIESQQNRLDQLTAKAYKRRKSDFERNKKIQKAVAIVENITAGIKAYNNAGGGWTGAAALAFSLATGYAQVRKICQTKFDGGGAPAAAGGGGSAGQAAANAGQAAGGTQQAPPLPDQNLGGDINITLNGGDNAVFTMSQVRGMVEQIREAGLNRRLVDA